MKRLSQIGLDHPCCAIGLFLFLTACWLCALPRLQLATDGRTLLPPNYPAARFQQQVDRDYARSDFLVIGVEARDTHDVFAPTPLNYILHLSHALEAILQGTDLRVRSLATVSFPRSSDAGLVLSPLLDREIASTAEAESIRINAQRFSSFIPTLISEDGTGAAIYVPIPDGVDRRAFVRRVQDVLSSEWNNIPRSQAQNLQYHLLGPPVVESSLGDYILHDLAVLLPLTLVGGGVLLWYWFDHPGMFIIAFAELAGVEIWTLGLMGALGRPLSLVTIVMPVILATWCVADTIQIAQRFREKSDILRGDSRRLAMNIALTEVWRPIVFASLATCVGFLSFIASPILPIRDFGLFTAFGVACDLAVSLFVIPPALFISGFGKRKAEPLRQRPLNLLLARLASVTLQCPRLVLAATLVASAVICLGMLRFHVQDSWIDNFSPRSALFRSDDWFNAHFLGTNVLNIVVDTGTAGSAYDPTSLRQVEELQQRLSKLPTVGSSLSLANYLRAFGGFVDKDRLPTTRDETVRWLALSQVAGTQPFNSYVNRLGTGLNVWVFLRHADYAKMKTVLQTVQDFKHEQDDYLRIQFAGDAYRGYVLIDVITQSLSLSVLTSLLLIFITY